MKQSLLVLVALAAGATLARADSKLVIKGSDTLGAKLVPQLAEAYKAQNPGVSFEIAAEGSTTGISAIIDPLGRVQAELGLDRMGALDGTLPQALPPTFYALHGDVLFAGLLVLLGGIAGVVSRPTKPNSHR